MRPLNTLSYVDILTFVRTRGIDFTLLFCYSVLHALLALYDDLIVQFATYVHFVVTELQSYKTPRVSFSLRCVSF